MFSLELIGVEGSAMTNPLCTSNKLFGDSRGLLCGQTVETRNMGGAFLWLDVGV